MFLESDCRWMRYGTSRTHTHLWNTCREPSVLKGFTFLRFLENLETACKRRQSSRLFHTKINCPPNSCPNRLGFTEKDRTPSHTSAWLSKFRKIPTPLTVQTGRCGEVREPAPSRTRALFPPVHRRSCTGHRDGTGGLLALPCLLLDCEHSGSSGCVRGGS